MKCMMIVCAMVVTLVTPQTASAAPRCPGGIWTPNGCVYEPAGMTCAWPFRLVKVGKVALCIRQAGEAQP
jgi:hypothetical protein